jgi:hypothetical protein
MRFSMGWLLSAFLASTMAGQQSPFQGSVATGVPSSAPLALTLHDAIDRGLKTNLGLLVSGSASETVRVERLGALSALMPQLSSRVGETVQQSNLETVGFNFHFPGVSIPTIVGPFHYTDVRAVLIGVEFDRKAL